MTVWQESLPAISRTLRRAVEIFKILAALLKSLAGGQPTPPTFRFCSSDDHKKFWAIAQ